MGSGEGVGNLSGKLRSLGPVEVLGGSVEAVEAAAQGLARAGTP